MVKRSILISVAAAYENICLVLQDPHPWIHTSGNARPQRSSRYLGLRRTLYVEMLLWVAVWRTGCEYPPSEGQ